MIIVLCRAVGIKAFSLPDEYDNWASFWEHQPLPSAESWIATLSARGWVQVFSCTVRCFASWSIASEEGTPDTCFCPSIGASAASDGMRLHRPKKTPWQPLTFVGGCFSAHKTILQPPLNRFAMSQKGWDSIEESLKATSTLCFYNLWLVVNVTSLEPAESCKNQLVFRFISDNTNVS